ncbi:MAG: hypothetical protein C0467_33140 [Planctomycetaceae bacterium]|nr:hypothetical protein [Planctomycetaceae bacterium]PPD31049.1 MAG: hypothetical protein CTY20_01405 [Hyphomicrobium sp.]
MSEPEPERNALAAQTRNASALPEIVGKRELAEYLGCHTKSLERRVAKGERPRPMTLPSGRGYWSGERIARELDAVIAVRIRPALIVSDNGTEFTSTAMPGLATGDGYRLAPSIAPPWLAAKAGLPPEAASLTRTGVVQ